MIHSDESDGISGARPLPPGLQGRLTSSVAPRPAPEGIPIDSDSDGIPATRPVPPGVGAHRPSSGVRRTATVTIRIDSGSDGTPSMRPVPSGVRAVQTLNAPRRPVPERGSDVDSNSDGIPGSRPVPPGAQPRQPSTMPRRPAPEGALELNSHPASSGSRRTAPEVISLDSDSDSIPGGRPVPPGLQSRKPSSTRRRPAPEGAVEHLSLPASSGCRRPDPEAIPADSDSDGIPGTRPVPLGVQSHYTSTAPRRKAPDTIHIDSESDSTPFARPVPRVVQARLVSSVGGHPPAAPQDVLEIDSDSDSIPTSRPVPHRVQHLAPGGRGQPAPRVILEIDLDSDDSIPSTRPVPPGVQSRQASIRPHRSAPDGIHIDSHIDSIASTRPVPPAIQARHVLSGYRPEAPDSNVRIDSIPASRPVPHGVQADKHQSMGGHRRPASEGTSSVPNMGQEVLATAAHTSRFNDIEAMSGNTAIGVGNAEDILASDPVPSTRLTNVVSLVDKAIEETRAPTTIKRFYPPPEARFTSNRNVARRDSPMNPLDDNEDPITPLDIDLDDAVCSSNFHPHVKFFYTEQMLYNVHLAVESSNLGDNSYANKLHVMQGARRNQLRAEMLSVNMLKDIRKDLDRMGDILRPWL